MLGDVRVQLRPGVQIVPRAQWPPAFSGHPAEWTAALSAPGLRTTSRLIDEPTRRFLELLREPMAVTAAVLRTAEQYGGDPVAILESDRSGRRPFRSGGAGPGGHDDLADCRARPRHQGVVYGTGRIDASGRVTDQAITCALGWREGEIGSGRTAAGLTRSVPG
jgi:hypothetical protein